MRSIFTPHILWHKPRQHGRYHASRGKRNGSKTRSSQISSAKKEGIEKGEIERDRKSQKVVP